MIRLRIFRNKIHLVFFIDCCIIVNRVLQSRYFIFFHITCTLHVIYTLVTYVIVITYITSHYILYISASSNLKLLQMHKNPQQRVKVHFS